jgi:hypothetical protein
MTDLSHLAPRILESLRTRGYHYEPRFGTAADGPAQLVRLARSLGEVFVAGDMDPDLPVLVTEPTEDAPSWKPFDRAEAIGWHNDFSTMEDRPLLSLAWIARADPDPERGAWRVASCARVLDHMAEEPGGDGALAVLGEPFPFGYADSESAAWYPIVAPVPGERERRGMRFYARALREGARLCFDEVPVATEQIMAAVGRAADAVGKTLPATEHALLVCHNWLAFHDRAAQTTRGPLPLRRSVLCFVRALKDPV